MERITVSTKLNKDLYKQVQILAVLLERNIGDLLEEGMQLVMERYTREGEIDMTMILKEEKE